MKKTLRICIISLWLGTTVSFGQSPEQVIADIQKEANENSQLELLAHELMDVIGPRLVGTPQMKAANDWAVATYAKWGIEARNEAWGQWRGWQRGITHVDLVSPRTVSLNGMQLAWSPSTPKKGVTASLITMPIIADSLDFV
ncbi:MAG: peptidase M28, partial [Flavobacteriaceae bacterium]